MVIKHTDNFKLDADFNGDKFGIPVVLRPDVHQRVQAIIFQTRDSYGLSAISFHPFPRCSPGRVSASGFETENPAISLRQRGFYWLREPDLN
jgi:hypothetical protein